MNEILITVGVTSCAWAIATVIARLHRNTRTNVEETYRATCEQIEELSNSVDERERTTYEALEKQEQCLQCGIDEIRRYIDSRLDKLEAKLTPDK
jgi:hypothetical protein